VLLSHEILCVENEFGPMMDLMCLSIPWIFNDSFHSLCFLHLLEGRECTSTLNIVFGSG